MSGARAGRRDDPFRAVPVTRRSLLRAGVAGAAALTAGAAASRAAAAADRRRAGSHAPPAHRAPLPRDRRAPTGVYDLNQGWLFGGVYAPGAEAPGHSEAGFAAVTLPHTAVPLSWGDWDCNTWEQVWIYRRHLDGGLVGPGNRAFLDFDGVMTSATVFLNGVKLATHSGGYLPWSVELTPHLASADNVLAVAVDANWLDVPPDGAPGGATSIDYLEPGGIYRDVALRITPPVLVSDVFAKPVDVLTASPGVEIEVTVDSGDAPTQPVSLEAAVLDGGEVLASASGALALQAPGVTVAVITVTGLANLTLWSPDTPKLYQVSVTLTADGAPHTVTVNVGFREASFELDGFYLNGQRLEIFGLNRHQLFPYTGMAAPERLQRRDAELLRTELNCNMVRCSHYPQSPHFLDACDELGLMVWEEPPGWQYIGDGLYQRLVIENVQDMVLRDRNRPSVIVWATRPNESGDYPALYAQTRQVADALDGTRPTSGAMDVHSTADWAQDVFAYDDYETEQRQAALQPPIPGVPYLVTEAVGALDGSPMYRWIDTGASLSTQARMHAQVHDIAQSDPAYAGLLAWAGIDYASQVGYGRLWHNIKWPGVLDTFRVPKPGAAFYRSQVDPSVRPVLLPTFFWDFGPRSPANGPGPAAMIATNCERLEVYIGGVPTATAAPAGDLYPHLAYPPALVDLTVPDASARPDLRVDGYIGDQLVATLQMSGDPSRDALALTIEDAAIAGDGSDATRFTIRAADAYGNQRPYVAGDVTLHLVGPANLVTDNPFGLETYGGVGGGFIRSQPGGAGVATLTAIHPTLGQVVAQVAVRPAPPAGPRLGGSPPRVMTRPAAAHPTPEATALRLLRAQIRRSLTDMLSHRALDRPLGDLLRRRGYALTLVSAAGGRLDVELRAVRGRRTVRIGSATKAVRRAGRITVRVRLDRRGRALLAAARSRQRLTVTARFTPTGLPAVTVARVVTLHRP